MQPKCSRAYLLRGCLKLLNNTFQVALLDFQRGLNLEGSNPLLLYNAGVALLRMQRYAEGLVQFRAALEQTTGWTGECGSLAALEEAILLNAALCNFHLQQSSAALACFKRLLEIQPEHASNTQVLTTMALSCHHM